MRIISTRIHGIIDLIVSGTLIFTPFIFGFASVGGAAVVIPIILGIVLVFYSELTDDEEGILRVISMPFHMMLDIVLAAGLMLSPYLFNFVDQPLNVWLPHVVIGIILMVVTLLTNTVPYARRHPRYPHSAL